MIDRDEAKKNQRNFSKNRHHFRNSQDHRASQNDSETRADARLLAAGEATTQRITMGATRWTGNFLKKIMRNALK